jgi:hypothetical protein
MLSRLAVRIKLTLLLVMDYQADTLTRFMTAAQSADAIARVPDLIAMAETRA